MMEWVLLLVEDSGKENLRVRTSHISNESSKINVMFVKRKVILKKKKKNYLERKKRLKEKENGSNNPTMASKGYESANVLSISTKKKWY